MDAELVIVKHGILSPYPLLTTKDMDWFSDSINRHVLMQHFLPFTYLYIYNLYLYYNYIIKEDFTKLKKFF